MRRTFRPLAVLAAAVLLTSTTTSAAAQSPAPASASAELDAALRLAERDPQAGYRRLEELAPTTPRAGWHAGMMLLRGTVGPADPQGAFVLFSRAAEAGDENGQISTAVMLATGDGVDEDDPTAREWYRRAAEGGSAHALRSLGGMLLTGEGGEGDPLTGVAYLELATEAGDRLADMMLRGVGALSDEQRAEVDAAKADWRTRFGDPRRADEPLEDGAALRAT